jgi:hypothetical protein
MFLFCAACPELRFRLASELFSCLVYCVVALKKVECNERSKDIGGWTVSKGASNGCQIFYSCLFFVTE